MTTVALPAPVPSAPGPTGGASAPRPPATEVDTRPTATRCYVRPTPLAWGAIALALLSSLLWLATESRPQMAVAITLLAALALDAVVARMALSRLELEVRGPSLAVAGESTEWEVAITGLRRPISLRPARSPRPRPIGIAAGSPGRVRMAAFPAGVIKDLVFDLSASGPIGLVEAARRVRVDLDQEVAIGPRPVPVEVEWPRRRAVAFGTVETSPRGDDLYRSVRPYVRGDERRRIHWKATAHHGELMVRESEGTGVVALQVAVEIDPDQPGPPAEYVAGVAAWLVGEALARGWVVQMVTLEVPAEASPPVRLGSPFGPPPTPAVPAPRPIQLRARRVSGAEAVNRRLASLGCGSVHPPPWSGPACVVSRGGIEWR